MFLLQLEEFKFSRLLSCSAPGSSASGPTHQTQNFLEFYFTENLFIVFHIFWIKFGRLLYYSLWSSSAGNELFNIWQESECHTLLTWDFIFLLAKTLKIVLLQADTSPQWTLNCQLILSSVCFVKGFVWSGILSSLSRSAYVTVSGQIPGCVEFAFDTHLRKTLQFVQFSFFDDKLWVLT